MDCSLNLIALLVSKNSCCFKSAIRTEIIWTGEGLKIRTFIPCIRAVISFIRYFIHRFTSRGQILLYLLAEARKLRFIYFHPVLSSIAVLSSNGFAMLVLQPIISPPPQARYTIETVLHISSLVIQSMLCPVG